MSRTFAVSTGGHIICYLNPDDFYLFEEKWHKPHKKLWSKVFIKMKTMTRIWMNDNAITEKTTITTEQTKKTEVLLFITLKTYRKKTERKIRVRDKGQKYSSK